MVFHSETVEVSLLQAPTRDNMDALIPRFSPVWCLPATDGGVFTVVLKASRCSGLESLWCTHDFTCLIK